MKIIRRLSIVIACMMTFLSGMAEVKAEGSESTKGETEKTYKLTLINKDREKHSYELYQVFAGTVETIDNGNNSYTVKLNDIEWGSGVKAAEASEKYGLAATEAADLTKKGATEARRFAEELVNNDLLSSEPDALLAVAAGGQGTSQPLKAGYYLVRDKSGSLLGEDQKEHGTYTLHMLQIIHDQVVSTKTDSPSVISRVGDFDESSGKSFKAYKEIGRAHV